MNVNRVLSELALTNLPLAVITHTAILTPSIAGWRLKKNYGAVASYSWQIGINIIRITINVY